MSGRGRRRWLRLRGRADVERELDEEIEAHIALRAEDLVRRGETPERARAQAVARFGDLEDARRMLRRSARERETELRRRDIVDGLRRDLTMAWRQARRGPAFSVLAVLTFAFGVGLTTAMYTLVDRVLLRPLPYPEADRLVSLMSMDSAGSTVPVVSQGNWLDWSERNETLANTALFAERAITVSTAAGAERAAGVAVAGPFFDVLGAPMRAGRAFTVEESQAGAPVAVVSEAFWRTRMNGDPLPAVPIRVDGHEMTVVGVVPEGREYPAGGQVWTGFEYRRFTGAARNNINFQAIGRLRDGVPIERARTDLDAIARRIRESDPAGIYYSWGVVVQPLRDVITGDVSRPLGLLMGAVSIVLLIACANLAGLGLARAPGRTREVAMRMALGAGRARVLRQLITEVVVLAVVGGALGILLAWWGVRLVAMSAGSRIPRAEEVSVDGRVLVFALGVTVIAGLLTAIMPAVRAARVPLRALTGDARGSVRGGRGLPGATLVAAEVGLALVLLAAGGLLVRSYLAVVGRDLGFDPRGVVTAEVALTTPDYADPALRLVWWERLIEDARALPGVQSAALANWIPTGNTGGSFIEVEGRPDGRDGAGYRVVSDDYFAAIGVPLIAGRTFDSRDAKGSERVVIINRSMADTYWPNGDALGSRVRAVSMEAIMEGGPPWLTVIGIVGDVRQWGYETDPRAEMFALYRQVPHFTTTLNAIVRTSPAMAPRLREPVRSLVRASDPTIAPTVELLEDRVAALVGDRRLTMALLGAFGVLALLLSAIGIHGLLSFAVAQRTREIGVRAALGAGRSGIIALVLKSAMRVVLAGAVAGLFGAWAVTRLMGALLFDVSPLDPVTFAGAAIVLFVASLAAALIPTWRATRVDPLVALRQG